MHLLLTHPGLSENGKDLLLCLVGKPQLVGLGFSVTAVFFWYENFSA